MELEPENKKHKSKEEEDLDSLLLEWAKGREPTMQQWKSALGAQKVRNAEALKQRARGSFWNIFLEQISGVDNGLATNLEIWKKALGGDFLFSLPLFFFRRHVD
jgi:hypothetical protein